MPIDPEDKETVRAVATLISFHAVATANAGVPSDTPLTAEEADRVCDNAILLAERFTEKAWGILQTLENARDKRQRSR